MSNAARKMVGKIGRSDEVHHLEPAEPPLTRPVPFGRRRRQRVLGRDLPGEGSGQHAVLSLCERKDAVGA